MERKHSGYFQWELFWGELHRGLGLPGLLTLTLTSLSTLQFGRQAELGLLLEVSCVVPFLGPAIAQQPGSSLPESLPLSFDCVLLLLQE